MTIGLDASGMAQAEDALRELAEDAPPLVLRGKHAPPSWWTSEDEAAEESMAAAGLTAFSGRGA